jgi:hypothetical protein
MPEQKRIALKLLSISSLNLYNSVTDVKPDILLRKDSAFGWVKSLCSPQPNLNTTKKNRDKQITPYTSPLKKGFLIVDALCRLRRPLEGEVRDSDFSKLSPTTPRKSSKNCILKRTPPCMARLEQYHIYQ